jgi:hypothetical protein
MAKIKFDTANPDHSLLRTIILDRMRTHGSWKQIEHGHGGFESYFEFEPPRPNAYQDFENTVVDVFWELVTLGIIAPGNGVSQPNFPWFRITPYGRQVLQTPEYQPHDRGGYVALMKQRITNVDATALAYIDESLESFVRGNNVAAMVMLGHADIKQTQRYLNITDEELRRSMTGLWERRRQLKAVNQ